MKTKEELKELNGNIGRAFYAYCTAIEENLKESGKEHNVIGDDDEYDGIYLQIQDGDCVNTELIDKVRWNEEKGCVEYHCSEWNYKEANDWTPISWLCEDMEYVYEAIEW